MYFGHLLAVRLTRYYSNLANLGATVKVEQWQDVSDKHFKFYKVVWRHYSVEFAANLFRKRCTKFYQNHPSFLEDTVLQKHSGLFFSGHTVYLVNLSTANSYFTTINNINKIQIDLILVKSYIRHSSSAV